MALTRPHLDYTDYSMQLLSDKSAVRSTRGPIQLDDARIIDEKELEGFGEEESTEQKNVPRSAGKALADKDSRMAEKKRGKHEEKQVKRAGSQSASHNTFEALGTVDEGKARTNGDEGDGKQRGKFEKDIRT